MTPPIADKHDTQILSFKDFVDSVFTELNSPTNEWYADLRDYGYYYKPTYWENTLIPLAVRLYELAQNDDAVYWWLIREMSLVDLCKASKEDFRKREVFDVLLQLKPEHRRIILENSVPKHAEELQKALDNDDLETFRSLLPLIADDDTIYNIGRVLMRVDEVRDIFERTIHDTKGDSLGRLFVLIRAYYKYFSNEYKYKNRYCDGLANNVFLALYQTQYREDKVDFCEVAIKIGELWVKNLILASSLNKNLMPKSVSDVLCNILKSQSACNYHDLEEELTFCDDEEQTEDLKKRVGGWLDLEKYNGTFRVFEQEWRKTLPPFSCRCLSERWRRVRKPVLRNGNVKRSNVQDNCSPYIDSKNAIPMEELLKLRKDVPRLFELENKANHFNGCVDEGSQVVIEETLNEKARRLIGDLLPELKDHLNPRYKTEKLEKFFDDILISKDRPINEQVAQETIVKKLFNNRSKYEYQGLKVIVFCRIIGYLLSEKVSVFTGEPKPIAEKLQPFLTKTNVQNGKDPKSVENLRSYIDKAKTGITKPPGKSLIDKVLGLKES